MQCVSCELKGANSLVSPSSGGTRYIPIGLLLKYGLLERRDIEQQPTCDWYSPPGVCSEQVMVRSVSRVYCVRSTLLRFTRGSKPLCGCLGVQPRLLNVQRLVALYIQ